MAQIKLTFKTPLLPLSWVSITGAGKLKMNKDPQSIFAVDFMTFSKHSLAQVGYESVAYGHWFHNMNMFVYHTPLLKSLNDLNNA